MSIYFRHIQPVSPLKNYIEKMWIFQTDARMPEEEMKLVVPNGNLKLTLSFKNDVVASVCGKNYFSREHEITLTGLIDVPVILDTVHNSQAETIGIEFSPQGVYRFFHFNLKEIRNQIHSFDDLIGSEGRHLRQMINNSVTVQQKVDVLQNYLLKKLSVKPEDKIFEYCVEKVKASMGKITIKELEKKTGYSSRWLNMKFNEKLGVSPKNLSSIIRFNNYYQQYIQGHDKSMIRNDLCQLFYDQSHLIKDFRRFTGLPPGKLENQVNEFSKSYFKR